MHVFFQESDNSPIQLGIDGKRLTQPCEVAAAFAAYLRSVSSNHSMGDFSTNFPSADSLPMTPISYSPFLKAIRRRHPSKFVGLDGIIYFNIYVNSVLRFILNLRLSRRIFRTYWRKAGIVPIFKKRKTALVNNYRIITLLNTFSKKFEIILMNIFHAI